MAHMEPSSTAVGSCRRSASLRNYRTVSRVSRKGGGVLVLVPVVNSE